MVTFIIICAPALASNSINFKFGIYQPFMKSDLWEINLENLVFEKQDMQGTYFGIEYEHFVNRNVSLTFEGGYYKQEHNSFYRDVTYENDDPIYQSLSLETANFDLGVKLYPLGNQGRFSPYIGGGGTLLYWFYEQWGDFVNFEDLTVMQGEFLETEKYTVGFNAKAGFVIRLTRTFGVSAEAKYTIAKSDLSLFFEGFEKLDLGGWQATAGIHIRF